MRATGEPLWIVDNSDYVERLFAPYRETIGADFAAYRGHVFRCITYAMHFLGNEAAHRPLVETAFVYHDIGLWTERELAYLEPSEALALRDNEALALGCDPELLVACIHWHHKITPYRGRGSDVVNAVRKADWIDASQGHLRKGLSREQVVRVEAAIPDYGFPGVLQRLALDLGGSAVNGNFRVLRKVFKF